MKNKLILFASFIGTSIVCFAVVDAFDRYSKRMPDRSDAAPGTVDGAVHTTADPAADRQVARLLANCAGANPASSAGSHAGSVHASPVAASAGAMACCDESQASHNVDSAAANHACCAE